MELLSYGHLFHGEARLLLLGTEGEVVVQAAVPQDAAFVILYGLLSARQVSLGLIIVVQMEGELCGRHQSHLYRRFLGIGLLQIAGDAFILFLRLRLRGVLYLVYHVFQLVIFQRDFLQDGRRCFRSQLVEVFFARCDEKSAHVQGSRADEQLVFAFRIIAVGTVF